MNETDIELFQEYHLQKEKKIQEQEYKLLEVDCYGISTNNLEYLRVERREQEVKKRDLISLRKLLNSNEILKSNTVAVYLEPYHLQEEGEWVSEEGISIVTHTLVKDLGKTPENMVDFRIKSFKKMYEWKIKHQPGGRDIRQMNNFLNRLRKNSK